MKKVLLTLVLGSLAGAAFAQGETNVLPPNTVVLGTHILAAAPNNVPACPAGSEDPELTGVTPIVIGLANPNNVAGVQARITYDPAVVQFVDPVGTCQANQEGRGGVIGGAQVIPNYSKAATGEIFFAIASANGTSTGGPLITLYAKATGAAGTTSSLTVDASKFVVAGTGAKNSVDGKIIVGGPGEGTIGLGAAEGSVTTDGTNVFGANDQGVLTVAPAATLVFKNATQPAAARTGAPTEGRPVVRDGNIVLVSTNGKLQVFDATAANFGAKLTAAPGGVAGAGLPAGTTVRSTPAVANGKIFFSDSSGAMYAFNVADGTQAATVAAAGVSPTSSPAYVTAATGTRVVVGGSNSVQILNEDLTPVTGVTIPATGAVSSSPYVGPAGIGWVGTDSGQIITFDTNLGAPVGTADAGGPVRSPIFGTALGAIAVNTTGKVTVVSPAGVAVGAGAQLTPAAGTVPAGQDLFGFQQSIVVRGTSLAIGDSIGNLYKATVDAAGTVGAPTQTNYGSLPITALASPADGQLLFIINRNSILKTTF